jgi:hypothetical protein
LATTDDSGTAILSPSLQTIATVPNRNVNAPVWLNNTTLLYGVSTGLWSYNIQTNQSRLLATSALNSSISEITPSQDGSYVYVLSINQEASPQTYQLSRLGIKGQTPSTMLGELQVFLPNSVNGCGFNYLDFTNTTILVSGASSQEQTCLQQAQSYLQEYAINTNGFNFTFTSTDNSD